MWLVNWFDPEHRLRPITAKHRVRNERIAIFAASIQTAERNADLKGR